MRDDKRTRDEFLCVVCPNGCVIDAEFENNGERDVKPRLKAIEGNLCQRGEDWVRQEVENPMRTIAGSVLVKNGDFITASVRTTKPVPLARVMDVMNEIRAQNPEAPLRIGQILISNPRGLDTDVIITRNVVRVNQTGKVSPDAPEHRLESEEYPSCR